ncbi:hypothetical protein GBAR_LOCUS24755, partial [Geodia barretti]
MERSKSGSINFPGGRKVVLNRLVKKLGARIEKNEEAGGFKSKDKLLSCLSLLEPPPDA